jgi:hypothetical protein
LFAIQGGRAYLIKLKPGASALTWNLTGIPVLRQPDWIPDSLNFVGFAVAAGSEPTFATFFAAAPAHTGQPIYRLDALGKWAVVANPSSTSMRRGEAFWVNSKGASTFSGPVGVSTDQVRGLLFARLVIDQTIVIKNLAAVSRTISVQPAASVAPPVTNSPVLAGVVPLSFYVVDTTNKIFGWVQFNSTLQRTLAPGEEWRLRVEVNRDQMAAFNPPPGANGVLYQSLLRITDGAGVQSWIPVTSEGLTPAAVVSAFDVRGAADTTSPWAGLWVGSATIYKVSQPASISTPLDPKPVGAPLQLRLLVHVDGGGNPRLLQKVLQMAKDAVTKPDPSNPNNIIIVSPASQVLLTDESLTSRFTGATLRDGQPVARRFSSVAFSFSTPVLLSGSGAFGSGSIGCELNLDYDDPLNPFKHRYHPDHDNLNDRFQVKLDEGIESFTVTRQISMEFATQDPDGLTLPGWGDKRVGGNYQETIVGLHNQAIRIAGTFRLNRVSPIAVLNDGL